jgi:CheY-like chemotaxis protein
MSSAQSKISQMTIIIVDDEPNSMLVASDLLGFYGAKIHTATNGAEALEVLKTVQPDLIISDINMPVMDGWELIAAIRQNPALAQTPVLALTAHDRSDEIERGLALGFTSYLTKPISALTLLNDIMERVPLLAED